MRYLIAGGGGMLGRDLAAALGSRELTVLTRADLDVTDLAAARAAVSGHDVVINAAAYTRVDDAETHEDEAYAINATGASNLAIAASEAEAMLVQVSTDYVFDGSANSPYAEDAPLNPVSAYGRTKAAGETLALAANPHATLIVRTAWLYGANGGNFARTMLRLAGQRDQLTVVDDQVGQPTWTVDVASAIVALLDSGIRSGTFHATSSGQTSWFSFAQAIFEKAGLDPARVLPIDSASYGGAPRPAYSVLGHDGWARVGLPEPRAWDAALDSAVATGVLA